MTLLEKAEEQVGHRLMTTGGGYCGCPHEYGLVDPENFREYCSEHHCWECWGREYVEHQTKAEPERGQEAKADAGKVELDLVPVQILRDIAQVRMYGNAKYGDPDNWKTVEMRRYINALLRHLLAFLEDHGSKDEESGIEHYKHMACNMAFICDMMKG